MSINVAVYLLHCAKKNTIQYSFPDTFNCSIEWQGLINWMRFNHWYRDSESAESESLGDLIEIETCPRQIKIWRQQRCPRTWEITLNLGKINNHPGRKAFDSGNGRVFSQETSPRVIATLININSHWHRQQATTRSLGLGQESHLRNTGENFKYDL